MARNDPLRNFRFRLEIDGIQQAGFSDVAIAETTTDSIDYREGNEPTHVRKLSGLNKYGNITLKYGFTTDSIRMTGDSSGRTAIVTFAARAPAGDRSLPVPSSRGPGAPVRPGRHRDSRTRR